ncbi:MAG: dicarboxylate/amino acid:cation symporter, partial [Planctomycetota bacterium]
NSNYIVILQDQKMKGVIDSVSEKSIQVKFWESEREANTYYVATENGPSLPLRNNNGQLLAQMPSPQTSGKGVKIYLAIAKKVKGKETKSAGETIREVFVGDSTKNKEGLIPQNLFNAMLNMDLIPLIFFSILLGAALSTLGPRAKGVIDGFSVLNDAIMKIVEWIMVIAPVGIFGLVAGRIGAAGGFSGFLPELIAVGKYCFTVILGLTIHGIIILPALLWIFGKRNPWTFTKGMATALLNAFSTASSSATIPLTLEGVEKENGISHRTTSFVVPLGATVNMNGTALYEAVAAIFIAQVYGIPLPLSTQIIIVLTATLAAIGAAGIPEAGLVTMVIVLRAVDLPVEGIGLLLAVDWILDRFRTTINVWGDCVGAGIIETLENRAAAKEKV